MRVPELHSPPNTLQRIDAVWMFVSVDATGEGVCAVPMPGMLGPVPMIAADEARLEQLIPLARDLARLHRMTIRLVKLSVREDVLVIGPDGKDDVP